MSKQLPEHIVEKIEMANKYAYRAEQLNCEVEDWMEQNGVDYAWDALFDYKEEHGYVVSVESVQMVMDELEL